MNRIRNSLHLSIASLLIAANSFIPAEAAGRTNQSVANTILNGKGAPSSALGINGDFYIDISTFNIYGPKSKNKWPTPISLKGPSGASGDKGSTTSGAKGEPGEKGTKGEKGEAGAKGETGSQGAQGAQGAQGEQGLTGPTGPQGPQGPGSPLLAQFTITNTTQASSTVTGALQVAGGAGIGGKLYVGGDAVFSSTGTLTVPVGTTAQRPTTPIATDGLVRFNTTTNELESFIGNEYVSITDQFRFGITTPSSSLGNNGDFYYDKVRQEFYGPKEGGSWPAPVCLKEDKLDNVIYVSKNGSDTLYDGSTPAKAFKTIKKASEAARATTGNTTIKVASGDYFEDNPIRLLDF